MPRRRGAGCAGARARRPASATPTCTTAPGTSPVRPLPMTLGHEVAGIVEEVGQRRERPSPGRPGLPALQRHLRRLHLVRLGQRAVLPDGPHDRPLHGRRICPVHRRASAQRTAAACGDSLSSRAPRSCAPRPRRFTRCGSRGLRAGETAAIIGVGGLGMSAVQLARAFGALACSPLTSARRALSLRRGTARFPSTRARRDPGGADPQADRRQGRRRGGGAHRHGSVPCTRRCGAWRRWAGRCWWASPRAALTLDTYREVLGGEAQVIGSNDHLLSELPTVIEMARRGILDTSRVVTQSIPLEAGAINAALDGLEKFAGGIRTVVVP